MEEFTINNEEIRSVLDDLENINIESIEYVYLKDIFRTAKILKSSTQNLFNSKSFIDFINEKYDKQHFHSFHNKNEKCMLTSTTSKK